MAGSPNWNKRAVITAWVFGVPTVTIAILGYFRPPDPAHPTRFDFLSQVIAVPLWLAIIATVGIAAMAALAVRWFLQKCYAAGASSR